MSDDARGVDEENEFSEFDEELLLELDEHLTKSMMQLDEAIHLFDGMPEDEVTNALERLLDVKKGVGDVSQQLWDECESREIPESELETYEFPSG